MAGLKPTAGEPTATKTVRDPVGNSLDPARVMGHRMCVDCHKSEVAAWAKSDHANKVYESLRDPNSSAEKYAQELNIKPSDLVRNSICVDCHATPRKNRERQPDVITAVSCESCHNPAGGRNGWLNVHAAYGPLGTRREEGRGSSES